VYGFHAVGVDGRRRPRTSFAEMAADYVRELLEFQPQGPYLLAGNCYSGVLAYEVAHQLHLQGQRTALLVLIDAAPYGAGRRTRLELEREKFADFFRRDLAGKWAWIRRRAYGLRLKLERKAYWLVHDVLVRARLPLPRRLMSLRAAAWRARQTYVTPTSPVRITLFRAGAEETSYWPDAWTQFAQGGVEIHRIVAEGIRHDNMMKEPYVRALAAELTRCIEHALDADGGATSSSEAPGAPKAIAATVAHPMDQAAAPVEDET
jgi:thioesterase domain-containing protein